MKPWVIITLILIIIILILLIAFFLKDISDFFKVLIISIGGIITVLITKNKNEKSNEVIKNETDKINNNISFVNNSNDSDIIDRVRNERKKRKSK